MNKKQIKMEQERAFELVKQNKALEAREIYQKIIDIEPNNDSAHHMLSFTYVLNGEYEPALKHITKAIDLYKCCADYYNTAGSILRDLQELDKALLVLKQGLVCNQNNPETYNDLALVFNDLGQYDKAKLCFESSIALEPTAAFVHFNYALTLLKTGDYEKGWTEYEWRHKLASTAPQLPLQSDIKNKRFILHHEQGFGDTIQFIRFAKLLKDNEAAEINVSVPEPLERLIKTCPYVDQVNAEYMIGDYVIPMMSLPYIFGNQFLTNQYFNVKPKPKLPGFNVGIVWTSKKTPSNNCIFQDGNRILPSLATLAYKSAQQRLLKAEWFEDISKLVNLWSLQPDADEVGYIKKIDTKDFLDTAEFMTQLDLVISIDTATAHLAGALGIPTWLLLPFNSEWRWLINKSDTPWYPSMKLFRQPAKGDWISVINELTNNIKMLIK